MEHPRREQDIEILFQPMLIHVRLKDPKRSVGCFGKAFCFCDTCRRKIERRNFIPAMRKEDRIPALPTADIEQRERLIRRL